MCFSVLRRVQSTACKVESSERFLAICLYSGKPKKKRIDGSRRNASVPELLVLYVTAEVQVETTPSFRSRKQIPG